MLESATVTLNYKEFKELIDKANKVENLDKKVLRLETELENRDERKALDKISELLVDATQIGKTLKQKQGYIIQCIEVYCNTFNIPIDELLEED